MVTAVEILPPEVDGNSGPLCSYMSCAHKATCRQRGGKRRHLCGWHGRIKAFRPVDRLPGMQLKAQVLAIQFDDEQAFERLADWCDDRTLTIREVCDYIVRKALDRDGCP
jgi:hypothetical protein